MPGFIFTALFNGLAYAESDENKVRTRVQGRDSDSYTLYTEDIKTCGDMELCSDEQEPLIDVFRRATEGLEESVDVSSYSINEEDIGDIYEMLVLSSPKFYYLINSDGRYFYMYDASFDDGEWVIERIYPIYQLDVYDDDGFLDYEKRAAVTEEVRSNAELIDDELNNIMSYVSGTSDDLTMAIRLHNYICINYNYDYGTAGSINNTVFNMSRNGKGQCQAYAALYNYIAMEYGLETGFVTNRYNNGDAYHIWNLIKLRSPEDDSEGWYHVDVTWDDTEGETYGMVSMRYFLLSDAIMRETHDNISTDKGMITYGDIGVETESMYDDAPWRNAQSGVEAAYGKLYYIEPGNTGKSELCSLDYRDITGETQVICSFENNWSDGGCHSGIGVVNGALYFNDADGVYEYDLSTGTTENVLSADIDGEVYKCFSDGTSIHYGVRSEGCSEVKDERIWVTDYGISEVWCEDGVLKFRVCTDDLHSPEHSLDIFVADGDDIKCIDFEDCSDGEVQIDIENEDSFRVFFWDEKMRPYLKSSEISAVL